MEKKVDYSAKGVFIAHAWGGGKLLYPTVKLTGGSRKSIEDQAKDELKGGLDNGMGVKKIIGALLIVTYKTSILVDGKWYEREDQDDDLLVGELSPEDEYKLKLEESLYRFI
jgi:hypothetical protein